MITRLQHKNILSYFLIHMRFITTSPKQTIGREGKSQGVIAHVAATHQGRISNDPASDPNWLGDVNPEKFTTMNLLTVPVLADIDVDVAGSPAK